MNANSIVMQGCLELAKKYGIQEVTYRAFASRIKSVTGISVKTSELIDFYESGGDVMAKSVKAYDRWTEKQVGSDLLLEIENSGRTFFYNILEMHLLGFISEELLVKEIRTNQKMVKECGGICTIKWGMVVADIKAFQEAKAKPKRATKSK